AGGVPRHVGRTIEVVTFDARPNRRRRCGAASCAALTRRCRRAAAFSVTAPAGSRRAAWNVDGLGLAPHRHLHASLRIELDDHARSLIDHPDVVLRIDPHVMREDETVQALADLADVLTGGVELKQARRAIAAHERPLGAESDA